MKRQLMSAILAVALLTGSFAPALQGMGQPTTQEIDDRPGVEVVATAEAQSGGDIAKQMSAFLTVPNVLGGWFKTDTVNTTETDANQTKLDIYQSAQNSKSNFEVYNASINNYLEDSMSIALMEGKNAYIRALNNQSSEAAATTAAKAAQDDYYSVKEYNLLSRWQNQVDNIQYLRGVARNETGVSEGFVFIDDQDYGTNVQSLSFEGWEDVTVTLQNQSTRTVEAPVLNLTYTENTGETKYQSDVIGPKTVTEQYGKVRASQDVGSNDTTVTDSYGAWFSAFTVAAPTDEFDDAPVLEFGAYGSAFARIDSQTTTAHTEVENFVSNTYTEYQTGEINNTDLLDPYQVQRDYAPNGSFQSWSTMSLTMLGTNTPENVAKVGHFKIIAGSAQYDGMLLSDESPQSGQFEAGTTYNPDVIGGQQYVVTDSNIIELKINFTVQNITNSEGENVQNVSIREVDYDTVNTTEYNELMEELQLLRAEVEAREQRQRNQAGVGWLPNFGDGFGFGKGLLAGGAAGIVVAIIGVLAILALLYPLLGPALIS